MRSYFRRGCGRSSLYALLLPTVAVAAPQVRITPDPGWALIAPLPATPAPAPDSARGGTEPLLDDEQMNAVVVPFEHYQRGAVRVLNEQGVSTASQWKIDFDPSYQDLRLHRMRIHRGGKVIDRLDAGSVKVIQRETRLEYQAYDGRLTAVIILDDVRPGDIVEYATTLRGRNPALAGHFQYGMSLIGQWSPGGFRRRFLWPAGKPLAIRPVATDVSPSIVRGPQSSEYTWTPERPGMLERDQDQPSWYVPGPYVLLSSYQSWNEVARWGAELFRVPAPASSAVRDKARQIRAQAAGTHDQALIAIRFVQDEVRYLANSFGEGALRPSDPRLVMRRRFGDCKDKALLLVSLLRELGIRADPALVSSSMRRKVLGWLPGSGVFDHVIVRLEVEGRTYWIDPTRQGQRGAALSRLYTPTFGYALVLDPSSESLTAVEQTAESRSQTTIRRSFLGAGHEEAASLTVESIYQGGSAEDLRVHIADVGRAELQETYLRYYTSIYPQIAVTEPIDVIDYEPLNRLRLVEHYSIPGFWEKAENEEDQHAALTAVEMLGFFDVPRKGKRTTPIGVYHPLRLVCETTVRTPNGWNIEPESLRVENTALRFLSRTRVIGDQLVIHHEYETLSDSVAASAGEAYIRDVERIRDALTFVAQTGRETPSGPSSAGIIAGIVVAMGCALASNQLYWRRRGRPGWVERRFIAMAPPRPEAVTPAAEAVTPAPEPAAPESPLKIGGWLHVVAAGLLITTPFVLYRTFESIGFFHQGLWDALIHPRNATFHPLTAPTAFVEICTRAALFAFSVPPLILFFARRRDFTHAWFGMQILALMFVLIELGLYAANPDIPDKSKVEQVSVVIRSGLGFILWGLYLTRSRRVARTFVR